MENNNEGVGKIIIDLFDNNDNDFFGDGEKHPWGNIKCASKYILVGMYEEGKVARSLFYMDKQKAEQLGRMLLMLSKTMN